MSVFMNGVSPSVSENDSGSQDWSLIGQISTECGAMCFVPTKKKDYQEMIDQGVAPESVFLHLSTPAHIYFKAGEDDEWKALIHFCSDNVFNHLPEEIKAEIKTNNLSYIGMVTLDPISTPILRICDAREAHLVPKSPTREQLIYAAKKCNFPLDPTTQPNVYSWQFSETLASMGETYQLEFWTGLNPEPLIQACEIEGLCGFRPLSAEQPNHWVLPMVYSKAEIEKQYNLFYTLKENLQFRCGFDMKAKHFVYDICHNAIDNAVAENAAVYPTNQGMAVGVMANNDSYVVLQKEARVLSDVNDTNNVQTANKQLFYIVERYSDWEDAIA